MSIISYPLMMVVRADGSFQGDGHAVAFTSVADASAYLGANGGDGLTLRFIHRKNAVLLAADLYEVCKAGLLLNPGRDGSGGRAVPLADLMEQDRASN
jgi:hypothetical protein